MAGRCGCAVGGEPAPRDRCNGSALRDAEHAPPEPAALARHQPLHRGRGLGSVRRGARARETLANERSAPRVARRSCGARRIDRRAHHRRHGPVPPGIRGAAAAPIERSRRSRPVQSVRGHTGDAEEATRGHAAHGDDEPANVSPADNAGALRRPGFSTGQCASGRSHRRRAHPAV